jgi:hypothetical protein
MTLRSRESRDASHECAADTQDVDVHVKPQKLSVNLPAADGNDAG